MYDPDLLFSVADTLRANIVDIYPAYVDVLTCTPPSETTSYVYPGERPVEGCQALVVSIDNIIPMSAGNVEAVDEPTCAYLTGVDFRVRLQQCHKVREDGEPLNPAESAASAQCLYGLMWVTWTEVLKMWRENTLLAPFVKDCSDITLSPFTPENPQGGMVYADMILRAKINPVTLTS